MTAQAMRPRLVLTMGDAAGIGPEVVVAAWENPAVHAACRPLVCGHPDVLCRAAKLRGLPLRIVEISDSAAIADAPVDPHQLVCLRVGDDDVRDVPAGKVDARAGRAAYEAVRRAAGLALEGIVDGIVTAPLNKAALRSAGLNYPGHTEMLAEFCGVDEFAMMLYLPRDVAVNCPAGLGIVHVTLHTALRDAIRALDSERIVSTAHLIHDAMQRFGVDRPRVGVCALNPHAGEDGLFGDEEERLIAPAVAQANCAGLDISGPFPADTLMVRARDGEFDAVVAMYHDQGHIAMKLLAMHAAVNVTLGLPIVRTSVAHGTAFDRAWQGTARTESMVAAVTTAAQLAQRAAQRPQGNVG